MIYVVVGFGWWQRGGLGSWWVVSLELSFGGDSSVWCGGNYGGGVGFGFWFGFWILFGS